MTIAILCAMDEELAIIREKLNLIQVESGSPWPVFVTEDKSMIAAITGIGKVNAAACCSYLITNFKVEKIVGIGVAGGIAQDLKVGDIVICKDALQHDIDCTAFGYEMGVIPRLEMSVFEASDSLTEAALNAAQKVNLDLTVRTGRILSGDCFVAGGEMGQALCSTFTGDCVDMESAAWAHVAYLYKIPWVIIRSISDQANGEAPDDFNAFLRQAVDNMTELVVKMLPMV